MNNRKRGRSGLERARPGRIGRSHPTKSRRICDGPAAASQRRGAGSGGTLKVVASAREVGGEKEVRVPQDHPHPHSASVDREDVDRFDRLGELWWDASGKMGILHDINPVRVDYVRDHACRHFKVDGVARDRFGAQPLEGLTIADIGCGGGILSESLAELGGALTSIDPAPNNIEVARRHAERSGLAIDYRNATAEALAESGAQFDIVVALEVLEHVAGPKAFVATLGRLVKPGGLLFLATLDRTLKSYALAIVGAEYVLGWVPRGTHDWEKFVRPDELSAWLRHAGLREIDRAGMTYQPFSRSWRKSRDTDVNYLMVAKKPA
jgi:2-polyprenyl-6-hydroxyphenyl methylase/3-demethylubiquinone-9 3-methyltransferase